MIAKSDVISNFSLVILILYIVKVDFTRNIRNIFFRNIEKVIFKYV